MLIGTYTIYIWTFNLLVLNNILYFLSDPSALVSWLTWVWHEFATYSLGRLYKNVCLMSRVWVLCGRYHQWWYPSVVPSVCFHLNHTFSLSTFIGVVVVVSFELHFKQNMTITIFTLALIKNSIRYRTIQHYLPSYLYKFMYIYNNYSYLSNSIRLFHVSVWTLACNCVFIIDCCLCWALIYK